MTENIKELVIALADARQNRAEAKAELDGLTASFHAVEYAAVMTAMEYRDPPIKISKPELIAYCKAMQAMASGVVFARETTVEIRRRPDLVLKDIQDSIDEYPENERKTIVI